MVRKIAWLLALAFLFAPSVAADEDDSESADDGSENQNATAGCAVYRSNPSGHPTNRIIIDPDGCIRGWIQDTADIGSHGNSDEESGG